MVQAEIAEAAKQGAGLIELRLDFLRHAPDFKRLLADKPCPMIATVRRAQDGGKWTGSEDDRQMLLRQAVVAGFDWVDLETDVADKIRRFKDVRRIVSYHNLREAPPDLEEIHAKMCTQDADVVKVAVRAGKPSDNLRVLALVQKATKPTVGLCMGDGGMPARLLGALLGAPFTYAAFNKERNIAPGIPSFQELKHIYNYPALNVETQVYGVVGDPVAHSLSPLVHNHAFRAVGVNAVYLPFRVAKADLPGFLKDFDRLPVRGYSVTIPHKEAAAAIAKHHFGPVLKTRAANTLLRGDDGFTAANTDYTGFLAAVKSHYEPTGGGLRGKAVLVLGAGGVARAVASGVQAEGGVLTVTNRTADRARQLAEDVGCKYIEWGARHQALCDLLVNCTSVGMHPNVDESPVHARNPGNAAAR